MNVTPGGQSALLRPWHLPRPPPLTLSPSNLLYLLKRKTPPILFQPVKTLEPTPWSATGFFAPKINNMEVFFL